MKQKSLVIILLSVVGVLAVFGLVIASSYISNYNYGNRAENQIVAEYKNMENILAQYLVKIKEAAQIPQMQTDDLVKIFTNTLPKRYGENGSQAAFQWIQEQNPQLDQGTYKQLMRLIEAGRNKFENAQTKFIDTKRTYNTNLGSFWKGWWLGLAGYPKIDLGEYEIVSSEHAQETFETKVDKGLQLR